MKNFTVSTAVLCVAFSCSVFAQTDKKETTTTPVTKDEHAGHQHAADPTKAAMSKEEEEMMKAWMAYSTPGSAHEMLAKDNGEWNEEITMWMGPGAAPSKNTATAVNSMILGGRYQQSFHKGTFEGMPFEGISTVGYDNAKKKYISTWIDNMGTGFMIMEGSYDPATKMIRTKGKQVDPVTGKDMDVREEISMVDDNTQIMRMFMTPVGGKEYKSMEIKLTRKM
jgi:hypothetical protein